MQGYVVRPARPTARMRRNTWESAKRWGVVIKHFYIDRTEAEADAAKATEITGVRFEVKDAEGI